MKYCITFTSCDGTDERGFVNQHNAFEVDMNDEHFSKDCKFFNTHDEAMNMKTKLLDLSLPVTMKICKVKGDKIMTVEERKEALFAEMIKEENMKNLVMMIHMLLPEFPINVHYTIEKDKTISISSDNIADNPILSLAWKEFRIENFNSRMCYSKGYFDNVHYWISLAYHYKHHDGGTNYAEIADVFFTEDLHWEMKKRKDY